MNARQLKTPYDSASNASEEALAWVSEADVQWRGFDLCRRLGRTP